MSTNIKLLLILGICVLFYGVLQADEILLTNGTKIKGVVISQDEKALLAETEFGTVTLKKESIASVKSDTADINFILRGDFYEKKAKYDEAMKYYGEAMIANPKSTVAKEKYSNLHKRIEANNREQLLNYAKSESEEPQVTDENVQGAEGKKKLNAKDDVVLTADGEAIFPPLPPKGQSKETIALQNAKLDALRKMFPKGLGIGFRTSGDKVTVLDEGELPNCKINIIDKQKTSMGYHVTVQVSGPSQSVMVDLPPDYPAIDTYGQTPDIKAPNKAEVQQRAVKNAIENGVKQAIKQKTTADPKHKKRNYFGRVFPITVLNEALTSNGYVMQVRLKIWFDPLSEG